MSTEIETNLTRHLLRSFWGGDHRGVCVQVTCSDPITGSPDQEGYIQLTMEDASELIGHLARFVKAEAVRRQGLLKQKIAGMEDMERTVFHEIANLAPELFEVPNGAVKFVSKFCPKTTHEN